MTTRHIPSSDVDHPIKEDNKIYPMEERINRAKKVQVVKCPLL
jgi:hypothetical protein